MYNAATTTHQGVKANTGAKVVKATLALHCTGPYNVLAVDPSSSAEIPDGSPLGANFTYLDLPSDRPGSDVCPHVAIERCKPCANHHDSSDMPTYLPEGLTQSMLDNISKNSLPYHVTQDDISAPLQRLEVEKISGPGTRWRPPGAMHDALGGTLRTILEARNGPPPLPQPQFVLLGRHSGPAPPNQPPLPPDEDWCGTA